MSIESSVIYDDKVQADGRRHIIEIHTDHVGVQHFYFYVGANDTDATANMNVRVAVVEEGLDESEQEGAYSRIEGGETALDVANTPVHSTAKKITKKLIYALVAIKNDENLTQMVILLEPLLDYLETNYTALQLRNFLDLTNVQLTKMQDKKNAILEIPAVATSVKDLIAEAEGYSEEIE